MTRIMHGKYTAEKGTMTMKKMKNFIALLLALVMTMSLMACGNKTDDRRGYRLLRADYRVR